MEHPIVSFSAFSCPLRRSISQLFGQCPIALACHRSLQLGPQIRQHSPRWTWPFRSGHRSALVSRHPTVLCQSSRTSHLWMLRTRGFQKHYLPAQLDMSSSPLPLSSVKFVDQKVVQLLFFSSFSSSALFPLLPDFAALHQTWSTFGRFSPRGGPTWIFYHRLKQRIDDPYSASNRLTVHSLHGQKTWRRLFGGWLAAYYFSVISYFPAFVNTLRSILVSIFWLWCHLNRRLVCLQFQWAWFSSPSLYESPGHKASWLHSEVGLDPSFV